jgi:hypothetical protein
LGDHVVLGLHGVSQGVEVGLLVGIVIVGEEQRDDPRRRCRHERGLCTSIGKRTLKTPNIGLDRFRATESHGADARGGGDFKPDGAGKVREVGEVGECQRRRRSIQACEPLTHIGRVAELARFTVADNVDADRALAFNDVAHGIIEQSRQIFGSAANRCVAVDGDEQLLDLCWTRKTSCMRRQDAIGFLQHCPFIPVQRRSCWRNGLWTSGIKWIV